MSISARTPVQIAWVTGDIGATETALTGLLGVKKWIRLNGVHFRPDTCTYRGQPADFVANISLSYLGDMQLELIEPVSGQSIYSEFLENGFLENGDGGLHHICTEAADQQSLQAELAAAAEIGAEVVMTGVMPRGMHFAYISNPGAGVPYLEIAFIPDEMRTFFDYIKQEQQ